MSQFESQQPELPAIGSLWKANDGRILRVEEWTQPTTYPADDWWAKCTVMNRAKGQRAKTALSLGNFGTFLKRSEQKAD